MKIDINDLIGSKTCLGDGIVTELTIEELIMRAIHKAQPAFKDLCQPVRVPGAYKVWAVGCGNSDVTFLVWEHDDGSFTIKNTCW